MSSEEDPVAWLRKEISDDLAFARACLRRPIRGTDFDAVNERVARCEAELAILDEHRLVLADPGDSYISHPEYRIARDRPTVEQVQMANMMHWLVHCHACRRAYPCQTVRLLAGGYRHRPGFPAAFAA